MSGGTMGRSLDCAQYDNNTLVAPTSQNSPVALWVASSLRSSQ